MTLANVSDHQRTIIIQSRISAIAQNDAWYADLCIKNEENDLKNLTKYQVAAVAAWIKIGAEAILSRSALEAPPERDAFIEAYARARLQDFTNLACDRESMTLGLQPLEFSRLCQEFSKSLKISHFPEIEELVLPPIPKLETPSDPSSGEKENVRDSDILVKQTEEPPDSIKEKCGDSPVMGDRVDYDKPIKRAWRTEIESFLDLNTPGKDFFQNAWVLCNPSQNPEPEISIYTDRGVPRQQIIAVERSAEVYPQFEERCRTLGIRPVFGDLAEVVPTLDISFRIVNLDWVGQVCRSKLETLSNLRLDKQAIVLLNYRIGREDADLQKSLGELAKIFRIRLLTNPYSSELPDVLSDRFGTGAVPNSKSLSFQELSKLSEVSTLKDARDESIGRLLMSICGTAHNKNALGLPQEAYEAICSDIDFVSDIRTTGSTTHPYGLLLSGIVRMIWLAYSKNIRAQMKIDAAVIEEAPTRKWGEICSMMSRAIYFNDFNRTVVEELEYKSQSGRGRSTFYSTFALLTNAWTLEAKWKAAPVFVFRCLTEIMKGMSYGNQLEGYTCAVRLEKPRNTLLQALSQSRHLILNLEYQGQPVYGCNIRVKNLIESLSDMEKAVGGRLHAAPSLRKVIETKD